MDLTKQKCEACTIDAPLVDKKRFTELLKDLDGWEIIYEDINILSKTYLFDNYEDSVKFATDIAKLAEDEDHHPSILLLLASGPCTIASSSLLLIYF